MHLRGSHNKQLFYKKTQLFYLPDHLKKITSYYPINLF